MGHIALDISCISNISCSWYDSNFPVWPLQIFLCLTPLPTGHTGSLHRPQHWVADECAGGGGQAIPKPGQSPWPGLGVRGQFVLQSREKSQSNSTHSIRVGVIYLPLLVPVRHLYNIIIHLTPSSANYKRPLSWHTARPLAYHLDLPLANYNVVQ